MGKGKFHYIEVVSDEEDDGDDEGIGQKNGEPSHLDTIEQASTRKHQSHDHCHTLRDPQILHLQGQNYLAGVEGYHPN
jgi:hypothetical protein